MNLSLSYRPRAVYANTANVRYSMMLLMRFTVTGDLTDLQGRGYTIGDPLEDGPSPNLHTPCHGEVKESKELL